VISGFKKFLQKFEPDVVHFASFDSSKPAQFIKIALDRGIKVVLQPWTMHFYCAQGFGFRDGHQCTLCLDGNYINAITKKCVPPKRVIGQIERLILNHYAIDAHAVLSSNHEMDILLGRYGIAKEKMFRFPIPFDCDSDQVNPAEEAEDDYFIFYGQGLPYKGIDILIKTFQELPEHRLRVYPMQKMEVGLSDCGNISIINGVSWKNGLRTAILRSKAVIIPSLWSSTTEYSLCEAWCLKKPVVAFNVGVHRDIIKNWENGIVVEPYNTDMLSKSVRMLAGDRNLRRTIGLNGYKTVKAINQHEVLYAKLIAAYR
jgi:glycosyltransferase involved in cell wall biosynthesis